LPRSPSSLATPARQLTCAPCAPGLRSATNLPRLDLRTDAWASVGCARMLRGGRTLAARTRAGEGGRSDHAGPLAASASAATPTGGGPRRRGSPPRPSRLPSRRTAQSQGDACDRGRGCTRRAATRKQPMHLPPLERYQRKGNIRWLDNRRGPSRYEVRSPSSEVQQRGTPPIARLRHDPKHSGMESPPRSRLLVSR
jgi:hypothetical protein